MYKYYYQMFYLASLKISAYFLNSEIFEIFDYKFILNVSLRERFSGHFAQTDDVN